MVSLRGARIPVKGILTQEQERRGYRLFESEDFVELYHLGECVGAFLASVKPWTLRAAADRHWAYEIRMR